MGFVDGRKWSVPGWRQSESADIVEVLRTLMIDHSLPLWSGQGWDQVAGGFVEKLDSEGRADRAAPRRIHI
jgi:mannose-6-phosphate isomerase